MDLARRLHVDPALAQPLWSQIEDGVRRLVASGALPRGELLPSVRDLARALRVNPGTVVRAYQRLVERGLLEARQGEGTFVASTAAVVPAGRRRHEVAAAAARFVAVAAGLGLDREAALGAVASAWDDLAREVTRP